MGVASHDCMRMCMGYIRLQNMNKTLLYIQLIKTRIRAYQSRNASACQAPSSAYKRGRARPEMVKHALTNGGYFQTLSFVCITYYYTHTQINDFMSMRRNRLDQVAGGIFWG